MTNVTTIRLGDIEKGLCEVLIDKGFATNKSDLIRDAIREYANARLKKKDSI